LKIKSLNIPTNVKDLLIQQGYDELYPAQEEGINQGALEGKNIILASPTASGKTLIAFLAAAKNVIENNGKVIYLTPLRALTSEKYEELKTLEELKKNNGENVRVYISSGDYSSNSENLGSGDIIVMTNEKFDSILRNGATWVDRVTLYIADEIHLIGGAHRGPTLEVTLAKILSLSQESQIIALSATIPNSNQISKWLKANLVKSEWRPVPLKEGVYNYGEIKFFEDRIEKVEVTNKGIPIDIAAGVLNDEGQSLIFAETRRKAVSLSLKASEVTNYHLSQDIRKKAEEVSLKILDAGEETKLTKTLADAVRKGAAFHHAGLDTSRRKIIENAYKEGIIKILCSTPTLAAGVNLPARRVVLNNIRRYNSETGSFEPISILEYKQMCGRAGRPKYDQYGETVLIFSTNYDPIEIASKYIYGKPEDIKSQLIKGNALRTHILATISSLPGMSLEEINELFSNTLMASQNNLDEIYFHIEDSTNRLEKQELISKKGKRYISTELGKKISMLYIEPDTGIIFKDAIMNIEQGKECTLGLLHLTVSSPDSLPKMYLRQKDWEELTEFLIGIGNELITEPKREMSMGGDEKMASIKLLRVICAWTDEWSEERILTDLGIEPGDLHRAIENCNWLLYSLREICNLYGRIDLISQIEQLRVRVRYGIKSELQSLAQFEGVGRIRARSLYNNGFKDFNTVSKSSIDKLSAVPKIGLTLAKSLKEQVKK